MDATASEVNARAIARKLPFTGMSGAVLEILERGAQVRMRVEGDSMIPWLGGGRDDVILVRPDERPWCRGDIVLLKDDRGRFILHRVVRRACGRVWLLGDAQSGEEGPWTDDHVMALVDRVIRKGREISMTSLRARGFAGLWGLCRPVRRPVLRWYNRLRAAMQRTGA